MIEAFSQALQEVNKENFNTRQSDVPSFAENMRSDKIKNYEEADQPLFQSDVTEARVEQIAENREKGAAREDQVYEELSKDFPEEDGYQISQEQYLRNADGTIARDNETGEARRIDFIVTKDGEIVKSIEVTSETASKTEQLAKEARIRENGGNYIKNNETGELMMMPLGLQTEVWRRP